MHEPRRTPDREAFYAKIATRSLAPLWEVLRGLQSAEPRPPETAALWHYDEVRPMLMEAGRLISATEAERRVLILENPALRGKSPPRITHSLFARLAARPAGRDRAEPSPQPERTALHHRRRGRLYGRRRRTDHDAAGRFRDHAFVDLARPRQRYHRSDGLAGRTRSRAGRYAQRGFFRGLRRRVDFRMRGPKATPRPVSEGGFCRWITSAAA